MDNIGRHRANTMNPSTSSLSLSIATFRAQTLSMLLSSSENSDQGFMALLSGQLQGMDEAAASTPLPVLGDTPTGATTGRNMALFDPESAYRMMTDINSRDVTYKAQYAELSAMGQWLQDMESAGSRLGDITPTSSDDDIRTSLQGFVEQYNRWIERFDADLAANGLLAGTQAAQMAQYELEQSVEYRFNGASNGMHGLGELGISIDPNTNLASLDYNWLDSALAGNKPGVRSALQEFGANFSKSAGLLTAEGNFVPSQLDNLKRAIGYITANLADWQTEFGTGDPARPSRQAALALAAYQQHYVA